MDARVCVRHQMRAGSCIQRPQKKEIVGATKQWAWMLPKRRLGRVRLTRQTNERENQRGGGRGWGCGRSGVVGAASYPSPSCLHNITAHRCRLKGKKKWDEVLLRPVFFLRIQSRWNWLYHRCIFSFTLILFTGQFLAQFSRSTFGSWFTFVTKIRLEFCHQHHGFLKGGLRKPRIPYSGNGHALSLENIKIKSA